MKINSKVTELQIIQSDNIAVKRVHIKRLVYSFVFRFFLKEKPVLQPPIIFSQQSATTIPGNKFPKGFFT